MGTQTQARQLALLGIILQSLHFLFGITAVIGMLVAHTRLKIIEQTVYRSHLAWQLLTFWVALVGYVLAFWFWKSQGSLWLVAAVAGWVVYRIGVNIQHWIQQRPIDRLL